MHVQGELAQQSHAFARQGALCCLFDAPTDFKAQTYIAPAIKASLLANLGIPTAWQEAVLSS